MKKCLFVCAILLIALVLALSASAEKSGTCGKNVQWVLADDGTLTISGSGIMTNYYSWHNEVSPWYNDRESILIVVIEPGVTSIGDEAFSGCSSLTSVNIPEGVTSIGNNAFSGCSSLTSVNIPEGVTSIGSEAFSGCSSLTSVNIPEGVTSIEGYAFSHCSSLISVIIPEGVTSIEDGAFSECISLTSVSIPKGVTSIGDYAFSGCISLTNVTIPESVTNIKSGTFFYCINLTSVNIPEGVTSIGDYAFYICSSLTSVSIPEGVTSIGDYAFSGCSGLTSITISEDVTSIGEESFSGCIGLKNISIPEDVTNIERKAFAWCNSLTSVSIPESVTRIEDMAFYACHNLTIYCYEYSYAEAWAEENGFPCVLLDGKTFAEVGSVTLAQDRLVMGRKDTCSLVADIFPAHMAPGAVWESSDPAVAVVDENGVVTPVGCGAATITVRVGEFADSVEVVVLTNEALFNETGSVSFAQEKLTVDKWKTFQLEAVISPADIAPAPVWESSDPTVATVDENGVLTPIKSGEVTITVRVGDKAASVEVEIIAVPEDFALPEELWLVAKTSRTMPVTVVPADADATFTWESDNAGLIAVDENGVVTARAVGTAVITATSVNGLTRTCLVHGCYPVTAVSFAESEASIALGETFQTVANVTMRSESCVNQLVAFASSDETVATVDENGLVTAVDGGVATISATAASGVTASCTVRVNGGPQLTLSADAVLAQVGDEFTVPVLNAPQGAAVAWTSGDETVATVADGRVTVLSAGTAQITVRCAGMTAARMTVAAQEMNVAVMPAHLRSVGAETFIAADFTAVDLRPCADVRVAEAAFADNAALRTVYLSAGTHLAENAFAGTTGVTLFCLTEEQAAYAQAGGFGFVMQ